MSANQTPLRLYEFGPTRAARCRWLLQELELPYECIEVDLRREEHREPWFLELNPNGKVPVLVDGDLILFESAAICLHLGDRFPERGLVPRPGTPERSLHDQWLFFCASELEQPLWRIRRHEVLYPEHRRVPADVPVAKEDFAEAARVLEAALEGRRYLVGDSFTAADIVAAHTLFWSTWHNLLDGFPALQAWLKVQLARQACPAALRDC